MKKEIYHEQVMSGIISVSNHTYEKNIMAENPKNAHTMWKYFEIYCLNHGSYKV